MIILPYQHPIHWSVSFSRCISESSFIFSARCWTGNRLKLNFLLLRNHGQINWWICFCEWLTMITVNIIKSNNEESEITRLIMENTVTHKDHKIMRVGEAQWSNFIIFLFTANIYESFPWSKCDMISDRWINWIPSITMKSYNKSCNIYFYFYSNLLQQKCTASVFTNSISQIIQVHILEMREILLTSLPINDGVFYVYTL